jgi:hypothetical protein
MRPFVTVQPEHSVNRQARPGSGVATDCQEPLPGTLRRAGTVAADDAEETMLDRVPFAAPGWVVAHADLESQSITHRRLEPLLPQGRR